MARRIRILQGTRFDVETWANEFLATLTPRQQNDVTVELDTLRLADDEFGFAQIRVTVLLSYPFDDQWKGE